MSRRSRAVQLGLAAVVGLVAGLLLLALDPSAGSVRPREAVSVGQSVTPSVHVFGAPVQAQVEVVVDASTVDPASVRVDPEFSPYEPAGPARVERSRVGDVAVVRFAYPLRCQKEGCDPSGARGVVEFPPGRVVYRFRGGTGRAVVPIDWPSFEVVSRVTDVDVDRIRWEAAEVTLPPTTYRADPTVLIGALLLLASLLGAIGIWLALHVWRRPRAAILAASARAARPARLNQAFALARSPSTNGDSTHRRRALERVAIELGAVGRSALADEARALAWSSREATDADIDDLAARAEVR